MSQLTQLFPSRENYIDVCSAIALIQESHDLNTTDLAKGNIVINHDTEVYESDFKFGFKELHQIGTVACRNNWFDTGIQWLDIAKQVSFDN
jgi:hypothetical protein